MARERIPMTVRARTLLVPMFLACACWAGAVLVASRARDMTGIALSLVLLFGGLIPVAVLYFRFPRSTVAAAMKSEK